MRIIGYTYDADVHCPTCTLEKAAIGLLIRQPPLQLDTDEHGLPYDLIDREGNPVHPIMDIDEHDFTHCGDCGADL